MPRRKLFSLVKPLKRRKWNTDDMQRAIVAVQKGESVEHNLLHRDMICHEVLYKVT